MKKSSKLFNERNKSFFIVILIVTLVCVAVVLPTATSVFRRIEGRTVQGVAKNIELTVRLLNIQYTGTNSPLIDNRRESGFTERAEADIRELSGATGDIYLLNWDNKNHHIIHLIYEENGYAVHIKAKGEQEYTWDVYRLDKVL